MTPNESKTKLQEIFQKVFENPSIVLKESMTADDIEEWDSLNHINLIMAVEKEFGVKFKNSQIAGLKNVGDLISLIHQYLKY